MDIIIHDNLNVSVLLSSNLSLVNQKMSTSDISTTNMGGEFSEVPMGDPLGAGSKDPLLSSWPFVIGISAASLAISVLIGILLAKRKIKKGFELYED
jgi:hypothetical protein